MVHDVPDEVREAARRAFAERDVQARVLPLRYDSLLAEQEAAGPRRLVFTDPACGEVAITVQDALPDDEVEIEVMAAGCSIVEVRCGGDLFPSEAPGRTVAGPTAHGLLSVVLEDDRGGRLRTAWIRV